jgi:hypothetical protein
VASQEAPVGTGTRSLLGSAVPGIRCCKWISGHSYRAYIIYIYQLMRVYTHGLYPKNAAPSREDKNLMVDHD